MRRGGGGVFGRLNEILQRLLNEPAAYFRRSAAIYPVCGKLFQYINRLHGERHFEPAPL